MVMNKTILLAHGSGSKLSRELIETRLLRPLGNEILAKLDDSAVLDVEGRIAFTTDSYVVNPIFFPGGDIGKLAVCGTVNDLSMSGAVPVFMSLSLIIEEGLSFDVLDRVVDSIKQAAEEACVQIVTGDTKVVNRGSADGLFINTSGIGLVPYGLDISGANAKAGDKVILSGYIGDHGIAVMSQREGLKFSVPVQSDCAPLNTLVARMLKASPLIHCLRDPTRGGLASALNEFAVQSGAGITLYEGTIPVRESVRAACELLGFDPLYVANEGKLVAVVDASVTGAVLDAMKKHPYGKDAVVIGEVTAEHPKRVVLTTMLGASRIVDVLSGELLPRIC
jgi:hydrogenase expression/formation protein HypE